MFVLKIRWVVFIVYVNFFSGGFGKLVIAVSGFDKKFCMMSFWMCLCLVCILWSVRSVLICFLWVLLILINNLDVNGMCFFFVSSMYRRRVFGRFVLYSSCVIFGFNNCLFVVFNINFCDVFMCCSIFNLFFVNIFVFMCGNNFVFRNIVSYVFVVYFVVFAYFNFFNFFCVFFCVVLGWLLNVNKYFVVFVVVFCCVMLMIFLSVMYTRFLVAFGS